jgi:hypothetical protein
MTSEESENVKPDLPPPRKRRRRKRKRRQASNAENKREENLFSIETPLAKRHVLCRPPNYPSKSSAAAPTTRRRSLRKGEAAFLQDYLGRLPSSMLGCLYSGMGGQPGRVNNKQRMIQLTMRALCQESRISGMLRKLHQRDRQALAILLQCGGLAHNEEFYGELIMSLGGNKNEWIRNLSTLSNKGLVATSEKKGGDFFFLLPGPLIPFLVEAMEEDLSMPTFAHEEMRVQGESTFTPSIEFSITTLSTYIDQHPPRLTQQRDIFKQHKEEIDTFFQQIWTSSSELFHFHIDFLMRHGMVELRGDRIGLNTATMDEWLQLDRKDQRALILAELDKLLPLTEWLFWVLHSVNGAWIPEKPLHSLYRRWRRGDNWRERYYSNDWKEKTSSRDVFGFSPLITTGFLELGEWGQEKFYRLSERSKGLLEDETEDFQQFYLTPSFDIIAPVGLSPKLFYRIGEVSELLSCDRTNTYKINEASIERALERGWRREELLDFLRTHSQIGIPENVEKTLRDWIGQHGDIEFHKVTLLTVHRSQVRKFESLRELKTHLVHRFGPGMYAIDPSRISELKKRLTELGFSPSSAKHHYPSSMADIGSRSRMQELSGEARELQQELLEMAHYADTPPESLTPMESQSKSRKKRKKPSLPPRTSPREARDLCETAIGTGKNLEMFYITRGGENRLLVLEPERVAVNAAGNHVLVAKDIENGTRLSYNITQIIRMKVV